MPTAPPCCRRRSGCGRRSCRCRRARYAARGRSRRRPARCWSRAPAPTSCSSSTARRRCRATRRCAAGASPRARPGSRLPEIARSCGRSSRTRSRRSRSATRRASCRSRSITTTSPRARGRSLFFATADARISGDGRACASCHPDGRDDALTWATPLGPRQTPMLAGRLDGTAPYGWNGDAPSIAAHLRRTFARLKGSGLAGDDLDALLAYVATLAPPAQPFDDDCCRACCSSRASPPPTRTRCPRSGRSRGSTPRTAARSTGRARSRSRSTTGCAATRCCRTASRCPRPT